MCIKPFTEQEMEILKIIMKEIKHRKVKYTFKSEHLGISKIEDNFTSLEVYERTEIDLPIIDRNNMK
ncbi:hypothetical protein CI105_08145 [Candidatus Izimaplasma bacterium ZiA1]|uniref:hypothetical protein n=1 Tax=Candidatus Izimoplasma sp. ZiA1 TaxID=2024899 RepID=UPI000BAA8CAE|nr:hypothetical protein CI105_08145 [Candidatus Izimaplasma bacterium ZiA1]